MSKTVTLSITTLLGLVIPFRVCAVDVETVRVGLPYDLAPLDLALSDRRVPTFALNAVYENLVSIDTDPHTGESNLVPEVATHWNRSEDGLRWIFVLGREHRFDDGSPVDAHAVKFSIDRVISMGRGPAAQLEFIQSINVIDRWTVEFTLQEANVLFLPLMATPITYIINPAIEAPNTSQDQISRWLSEHTAGSGPYQMIVAKRGQLYVLERNPYYHDKSGQVDRVEFVVVHDHTVRSMQIEKGDLDFAVDLPPDLLNQLESSENVDIFSGPSLAFFYVGLNTESGIFKDADMRRAAALAIDYENLTEAGLAGRGRPWHGPLMPGTEEFAPDTKGVQYDPQLAAELVARSMPARTPQVTMVYADTISELDTVAVILQAYLAQAGLNVRVEKLTETARIDKSARGDFDMYLSGWFVYYPDPAFLLNFFFDSAYIGSANSARYSDPEVDKLLRASLVETETAARAKLIHRAVDRILEATPYLYLYQREESIAVNNRICGFTFNSYMSSHLGFNKIAIECE